jgi:hypothetical protein
MASNTTVTFTRSIPGVIVNDTATGAAVLVEPGTYKVEAIDHDASCAYLDVPSIKTGWVAVVIHTDWLDAPAPDTTAPYRLA